MRRHNAPGTTPTADETQPSEEPFEEAQAMVSLLTTALLQKPVAATLSAERAEVYVAASGCDPGSYGLGVSDISPP